MSSEAAKCLKCGHSEGVRENGFCKAWGLAWPCGCVCTFTPAESERPNTVLADPANLLADSLELEGYKNVIADGPTVSFDFNNQRYVANPADPAESVAEPAELVARKIVEWFATLNHVPQNDLDKMLAEAAVASILRKMGKL